MALGTKISVTKSQRRLKKQAQNPKQSTAIRQLRPTKLGSWSKKASAVKAARRYVAF